MASGDDALLPLRTEFSQAWHGFDRNQVLQYLDHVEAQLRRLMSDRDSATAHANTLARELENARREIGRLNNRVEELKKPPERIEDLDERMQRTVQLANARAEEIVARAQEAAEKHWAESSTVSDKLHERYMKLLETLDGHADALQREHEDALAATKAEVEKMTTDAVRRRERLDAEAEHRRRQIEREFEARMTAERNALDKYIADQKTASKNQAERRIAEATTEAKRLVDEANATARRIIEEARADAERRTTEANETVQRLTRIREEARARLKEADAVLKQGESALVPVEDEDAELADVPAS
ncbi:hypothetical protein B0I33_10232 [Prauserella shujinwangii]|uniref:Cell wall synthesis protein Wag31 n=1 Tax=Prauserella shujinwangii TaxID=1453103 RepID=A0A2T0LZZ8_9PSEU|nr:cell division protein DivIVA [Prauserella shujinwangii]PRX49919.1 hypothetical protein B0I33_10232 [Prauserella shujinwangii]